MRILWAKSGGFLPLDNGGKIRSFNIARTLALRHEVTLFTFYQNLKPDPHLHLGEPFAGVERWPLSIPERASLREGLAYAANSVTTRPYQMRKYCRPLVRRRLRDLMAHKKHDVLICDFLLTAGVVPWDLGTPTVLFTHNVEAMIWRRHLLTNENPFWKLAAWREQRTIARAERHFTGLADHVLTVSDDDRACFLEFLPPEKVTTVPTGVDSDYFRPGQFAENPSLVFTGSMDWKPNEDGIVYFVKEVLPLIRQRIPQVTLSIIGRKPTRNLLALAANDRTIQVTGAVDDIRPYVHNSSVYIVPLRIGGGTRIKIFEAMAMGKPVVSTTIGAEGLPVEHNRQILLADTPDTFAARTVELMTQPLLRERLGQAGRALVESRYSWATVTNVIESAILQVVDGRKSLTVA